MTDLASPIVEEAREQGTAAVASAEELTDRLPVRQHRALCAITSGSTFPQAAEAAGVSRATIYRWVQSDPDFRAAYNAWQREQKESGRARLLKMTEKAVSVLEEALERSDERVAVTMLKELGVMRPARDGLTDPNLLKVQMQLHTQRREYRLDRATLRYLLTKAGFSKGEQRAYLRSRRPLPSPPRSGETNETPRDEMRRGETQNAENLVRLESPQVTQNQEHQNICANLNETNEAQ